MDIGPIFVLILYTMDCDLDCGFGPNFYPNTIHDGIKPNFKVAEHSFLVYRR